MPLPFSSFCPGFATTGQLSTSFRSPSPSMSSSQASPTPSPSRSDWLGLAISGQLSHCWPTMPSEMNGSMAGYRVGKPSPSGSTDSSHSAGSTPGTRGHGSSSFGTPSPSKSSSVGGSGRSGFDEFESSLSPFPSPPGLPPCSVSAGSSSSGSLESLLSERQPSMVIVDKTSRASVKKFSLLSIFEVLVRKYSKFVCRIGSLMRNKFLDI